MYILGSSQSKDFGSQIDGKMRIFMSCASAPRTLSTKSVSKRYLKMNRLKLFGMLFMITVMSLRGYCGEIVGTHEKFSKRQGYKYTLTHFATDQVGKRYTSMASIF